MQQILWMFRRLRYLLSPPKLLSLWRGNLSAWRRFWISYRRYKLLAPMDRQPSLEHLYPCVGEGTVETIIEPTYFYQDCWVFEKIVKKCPARHIDVGSHYKFVALLSKVVPVTMIDIRPLSLSMNTIDFKQGSILDLPYEDGTIESLSSLCVVEHIGLGRYGDSLDPYGSEKAIEELKRVVKPDGDLYLSLPIDDENRIYFNAHRAFTEDYIRTLFEPFNIVESRYIYNSEFVVQPKTGFGTGCYHLRRPP